MSEVFTVVVENVAVTLSQDILAAYAPTTRKLRILGVEIAANGQTTVGNYPIRIRYLPATVTSGGGGTAPTPHNTNPDGAAPLFTARANDVTHATSTGTIVTLVATQFNPINGYYWQPPREDGTPKADVSTAFALTLDQNPAASINLSATMWIEEI